MSADHRDPVSSLSVILPTVNESESLRHLVPALARELTPLVQRLEVIVVDDGSTDETVSVLEELRREIPGVRGIFRPPGEGSLPTAIARGLEESLGSHVMWLDADGSMEARVAARLVERWNSDAATRMETLVVGSRFISGGGGKGVDDAGATPFWRIVLNLRRSEDYLVAVFLSWGLNRLLWFALGRCCRDSTSGFVLTERRTALAVPLVGTYGDYFPRWIHRQHLRGVRIVEVPYIIRVRQSGTSKTGVTLLQILRSGLPYLRVVGDAIRRG